MASDKHSDLSDLKRCGWASGEKFKNKQFYIDYHDQEWGVPVYDDRTLFEFLILEGAQAGLSWETILKRRDGYRAVFYNFDVQKVAQMSDDTLEKARTDERIIRNTLKVYATRKNAQIFIDIQKEFGSFSNYLWGFVDGKPVFNRWHDGAIMPVTTNLSDRLSKDLKKRGMSFVGSTIMYAYLQAVGVVNDHEAECFRYGKA